MVDFFRLLVDSSVWMRSVCAVIYWVCSNHLVQCVCVCLFARKGRGESEMVEDIVYRLSLCTD